VSLAPIALFLPRQGQAVIYAEEKKTYINQNKIKKSIAFVL
jgi:hypothetical protein